MRSIRCVIIISICLIAGWYVFSFRHIWSYDHMKNRAEKLVSATELQS